MVPTARVMLSTLTLMCASVLCWMSAERGGAQQGRDSALLPLSAYKSQMASCSWQKSDGYVLFIKVGEERLLLDYYGSWKPPYPGDSGVDLMVPQNITVRAGWEPTIVPLGIRAAMFDRHGRPSSYYIYGRSSVSKTPLVLPNAPAIIDAGFRGELSLPVRLWYDPSIGQYTIAGGSRLAQIGTPDLTTPTVHLVSQLDDHTERAHRGFGSSGT